MKWWLTKIFDTMVTIGVIISLINSAQADSKNVNNFHGEPWFKVGVGLSVSFILPEYSDYSKSPSDFAGVEKIFGEVKIRYFKFLYGGIEGGRAKYIWDDDGGVQECVSIFIVPVEVRYPVYRLGIPSLDHESIVLWAEVIGVGVDWIYFSTVRGDSRSAYVYAPGVSAGIDIFWIFLRVHILPLVKPFVDRNFGFGFGLRFVF